jgi:hypothetical protein
MLLHAVSVLRKMWFSSCSLNEEAATLVATEVCMSRAYVQRYSGNAMKTSSF